MANEGIENIYLVNAPAGSGKTTMIKSMLADIVASNPNDNILCISYTNRAADELQKGIENKQIFFGTIHSYINSLIKPFLTNNEILELYWELYADKIKSRIANESDDVNIMESNQKYIDKYGELNETTVKDNIHRINYNETAFNSLYYGGLGHDDLIMFARTMADRYPIINKKIVSMYNVIFVDEYQDTSGDVLKLFYNAVCNTNVKLYLLGDRMQQIYKNYNGSFESELAQLNTEITLKVNYRSVPAIISILNKIYNDPAYSQEVFKDNQSAVPDYPPEVIICSNINSAIQQKQKLYPDILMLYLLNHDKFEEIGASKLYRAFSDMDKYSFPKKYHSNDVLSINTEENPDSLMKFLFVFHELMLLLTSGNFGQIITLCKKYKEFFTKGSCTVVKHADKTRILGSLILVSTLYCNDDVSSSIKELLDKLLEENIINEAFAKGLYEDHEYNNVLQIDIFEVRRLADYLKDPHISTQHGVKGESHSSVIFVAADSNHTPIVHMYGFFKVWCQVPFSLHEIEVLYYSYAEFVVNVEKNLGMPISDLKAETHNKNDANKTLLINASKQIMEKFADNKIFNLLCKGFYEDYLENPILGNVKKCFKTSTVYGVFMAYKLFYVGCSRARKNLTIIVDEAKISEFKDGFKTKVKEIGFTIKG